MVLQQPLKDKKNMDPMFFEVDGENQNVIKKLVKEVIELVVYKI